MHNIAIAALFEETADLLELQGANAFRVRAYRNAARTVEDLADSLSDLVSRPGFDLTSLGGIGKDLAEKLRTIVSTGTFRQLEELRSEFPEGVRAMLRIPGLGPKKVSVLHRELGVKSLDDLKVAAENGAVAELKGFGKKTAAMILEGIAHSQQAGQRFSINVARVSAEEIAVDLRQVPSVQTVEIAGSCRRRKETVGDLDILAIADDSAAVMDRLATHSLVQQVLARGETKQRVRLHSGIELDLRVVPAESFGAALQYFTGSKEHNIVVRQRAVERGLKINEYGVFRGDDRVAGATEEEVYRSVDLPWIPPELRENRREFELAARNDLPELLVLADICGDLHMHTTATDGQASIEEMILAAKSRGREYIAITDHSKRVTMANGLDASRLRRHWETIRETAARISGIHVLCGIECDILEDGPLDLDDDVLAEADWVLAVLHYGLKQPRDQIQKRLLGAIGNPNVDAIGHPSGRMVGHRPGADIDYREFLKAAADHGVALEINANPARLDLDDVHSAAAKELKIPIVINTDAHSTTGMDVMTYGVDQARRAGLTKSDVLNAQPYSQFSAWLKARI